MGPQDSMFELDTRGICLLCLRRCSPSSCGIPSSSGGNPSKLSYYYSPEERERVFQSFKMLMRYLNIDLLKQCNFSDSFLQSVDGLQRDVKMVVKMCSVCLEVCQQFSQIYRQFEMIRLELDECVQALFNVMQSGEVDKARVRDYQRMVKEGTSSWNPLQLFHASIADNLRRETLKKCSSKVEKLIPRVTITKSISDSEQKSDFYSSSQNPPSPGPICVITETKGDLENDEFAGPLSMLKVEAVFANGETSTLDDDQLMNATSHSNAHPDEDPDATYYDPLSNTTDVDEDDPDPSDPPSEPDPPYHPSSSSYASGNHDCRFCCKRFFSSGNLKIHQVCGHTLETFADRLPDGTTVYQLKDAVDQCVNKYKKIPNPKGNKPKYVVICAFCKKVCRDRFFLKLHILDIHFEKVLGALGGNLKFEKGAWGGGGFGEEKKTVAVKRTGGGGRGRGRGGKRGGRGGGGGGGVPVGGRKIKSDHDGPIYKCSFCRKEFTSLNCMRRHVKMFHTGGGKYLKRCSYCDKKFITANNLKVHMNTIHLFEAQGSQLPPGTTKPQLKATLVGISNEQKRTWGASKTKAVVGCSYCGKLTPDAFFFKAHLVEFHFDVLINRLEEFKGATAKNVENGGGGDSSSSNPLKGEENVQDDEEEDDEDEQEIPVNNFMSVGILELLQNNGSVTETQGMEEDDQQEMNNGVDDEGNAENPLQDDIIPPPPKSPKILKGLLGYSANNDKDGINDIPPTLDMYGAMD